MVADTSHVRFNIKRIRMESCRYLSAVEVRRKLLSQVLPMKKLSKFMAVHNRQSDVSLIVFV
jgi:hypothetical protein